MIISEKYAKELIRDGKAEITGHTTTAQTWDERAYGKTYITLDRFDHQRVDHVLMKSRTHKGGKEVKITKIGLRISVFSDQHGYEGDILEENFKYWLEEEAKDFFRQGGSAEIWHDAIRVFDTPITSVSRLRAQLRREMEMEKRDYDRETTLWQSGCPEKENSGLAGDDFDYGDHGFSDEEVCAAKRGRSAYREFLGY